MSKLQLVPSTTSVLTGGTGTGTKPEVFTVIRMPNHTFNQGELDFMKLVLKMAQESIEEVKSELVDYREALWGVCDKENPETHDAFLELNLVKSKLRKIRRDQHKLQNIFTKIKKQSKGLN